MTVSLRDLVAAQYETRLASDGHELVITCPLCADHKPRLFINLKTFKWICHHCHEAGLLVSFLEKVMGLDPFEAFRVSRKISPERGGREQQRATLSFDDKDVPGVRLADPGSMYEGVFWGYLSARGVTGDDIDFYRMRYCLLGPYGGRVIIPVVMNGEAQGFVARAIANREPKVLYPQGMKTSELLFGLDEVKGEEVILTEGVFDAIRLRGQAVATFGARLSAQQRNLLLQRGLRWVVILWDGDEAGWTATVEAVRQLQASGFHVSVASLPEGSDPASALEGDLTNALGDTLRPDVIWPKRKLRQELGHRAKRSAR